MYIFKIVKSEQSPMEQIHTRAIFTRAIVD